MTDKEHIEIIYRKIQEKYPDITNKEEIDNLAIKLDKRNTLLKSLGCFAGAIVCGIIWFLLAGNETHETTRYLFLVMAVSGIVECFRTLGKYSKIVQRYKPVIQVKYEGQLSRDKVLQDGGKILSNAQNVFDIVRLPLVDKEDETDVGLDNDTHHKYYLYFTLPENGVTVCYKVKRNQYMDSVIGAEYFVVVTPSNEIAAVYQATDWTLDSELSQFFVGMQRQSQSQTFDCQAQSNTQPYQPLTVQISVQPQKTKKLLPILAMVLMLFAFFTIILVGVPLGVAALVMAIVALTQQRSKLSIASMVVTGILFAILMLSVVWAFLG